MIPTQQPPGRRPRRYTEGATLTVVVLFTMLILSLIMIVTLRLTLSARTGGMDQKAILQSQYSAESNLALARSRLRDIQNVLTASNPNYLYLPNTAGLNDVVSWASSFCNISSSATWSSLNAGEDLVNDDPNTTKCTGSNLNANRFAILGNMVTTAAYASLPSSDNAPTSVNPTSNTTWWANYLNNISSPGLSFSVVPEKVLMAGSSFRFYFKPGPVTAATSGATSAGFRTISANPSQTGDWWVQIDVPNAFDNALFLDTWPKDDGGLYADIIKGNLFVNEKIRFLQSSNTVNFQGKVSSAGCTNLVTARPAPGSNIDCTAKTPGFYAPYDGSVITASNYYYPTLAQKNTYLTNKIVTMGSTIPSASAVNFNARYIELPLTYTQQLASATANGIVLPNTAKAVFLYAADGTGANGNLLTTYNTATSSWVEPSPTYQYIRVFSAVPSAPTPTTTTNVIDTYRIDSAGHIYKYSASTMPNWVYQRDVESISHGAVVYSPVSLTVFGPQRSSASTPGNVNLMPPAIASFARINLTVASTSGATTLMTLSTDLTVSNTPCSNNNRWFTAAGDAPQPGCPKATPPTNVLALYTPSGGVTMDMNTQTAATYHAAIMISKATFNVVNYDTRPYRGKRHVVGAVVASHYGLNGFLKNGTLYGYEDDFSQDARFKDPTIVPASPIPMNWTFSNPDDKNLDSLLWKQGTQ